MSMSFSELVTEYTNRLDEIVCQQALTTDLNINRDYLGDLTGAGQIKVAKIAMSGLADHTRGGGFTEGDASLTWETLNLTYDRDREFNIDVMDDDEQMRIVTARLMGEFARTKVVPEVDAIRFAKMAAKAGGTATAATYTTGDAALDAVLLAEEFMQDYGSALQDCVFYCSPSMKTLLRKSAQDSFQLRPGEAPNTNFQAFDEMRIVTVPAVRFYTGIELLDGKTTGETDGGYAKAQSGKDINFMIVNPDSVNAIVKHETLRYFAPDVNQADDAHKWQYRIYHDLFVLDNKVNGIYLSNKA